MSIQALEEALAEAKLKRLHAVSVSAQELDAAVGEIHAMREALEAVEWQRRGDGPWQRYCPWCDSLEKHAPTCQRQAALAPARSDTCPQCGAVLTCDASLEQSGQTRQTVVVSGVICLACDARAALAPAEATEEPT